MRLMRQSEAAHACKISCAAPRAASAAVAAEVAASVLDPAALASRASKKAVAHDTRTEAVYEVRALRKRCAVLPCRARQSSKVRGARAHRMQRDERSSDSLGGGDAEAAEEGPGGDGVRGMKTRGRGGGAVGPGSGWIVGDIGVEEGAGVGGGGAGDGDRP